jgi:hypothetical protein
VHGKGQLHTRQQRAAADHTLQQRQESDKVRGGVVDRASEITAHETTLSVTLVIGDSGSLRRVGSVVRCVLHCALQSRHPTNSRKKMNESEDCCCLVNQTSNFRRYLLHVLRVGRCLGVCVLLLHIR